MKPWSERSIEEANLLNPAFCCAALAMSIAGYSGVNDAGMPYPLTFMVLPIVLHKQTRESLPPSTRTSLAVWMQNNADAKVLYAERLLSLKPYTREAIQFGLLYDWIALRHGWLVQTTFEESISARILQNLDNEAKDCVSRAKLVGKWFALAGSAQTVMNLWGIRI
ncbi:MAG: DUF6521 family protein [Candidatus Pacebacteria bacterium]|nr:DUF6521 family protein [Candidatus Paceibacterota bacterium]